LLVDLRNAVRRVKSDVAEEIQASIVLQRMYEKQLREKEKQILETQKQVDAKDAALQVLATRKTFGRQISSIVFVFVVGVMCGACWNTKES
jgi:hypothetical protein